MLYASLVLGLAAASPVQLGAATLIVFAVTGGFCAQDAARKLVYARQKGRPQADLLPWLVVCTICALSAGLAAVAHPAVSGLWPVAAAGLVLMVVQAALPKRAMRSPWAQWLGIGGLCLALPAGAAAGAGELVSAWAMWLAAVLFYGGAVFHVNVLLAARTLSQPPAAEKRRLFRSSLSYLALAGVVIGLTAGLRGGAAGLLLSLAYLPAAARFLDGWRAVGGRLPSLKRVGLIETAYALWFVVLMLAAVRAW
jgi:hypothetical protein